MTAAACAAMSVAAVSARRDYEDGDRFSPRTQAVMWPAYALGGTVIVSNLVDSAHVGTRASRLAGGVAVIAGLAALTAGAWPFGSLSQLAGREPGDLITDGVFRYSRNPQYLGNVLLATGAAIANRSLLAGLFAGASAIAYTWYLPSEEAHLQRTFGSDYSEYLHRVPRWWRWRGLSLER